MSDLSQYHGANAGYVLELYDRYRLDPDSVDVDTRRLFESWNPEAQVALQPGPVTAPSPPVEHDREQPDIPRIVAAARLTRLIRERGHLAAHIDPLGSPPLGDTGLHVETHGLTEEYLASLPPTVVTGPLAIGAANALDAIERLRQVYSASVGYETDQVQTAEEREWLWQAIESGWFFEDFDDYRKRDILRRLTEVDTFEVYLDRATNHAKRFSIEGTDTLVPILDEIIHDAAVGRTREVVIGMAHRGRLNVLAHVLGKPYPDIIAEFLDAARSDSEVEENGRDSLGWTGDVKYHLGFKRAYRERGIGEMPITLVPNPSHLEFVNPVVEGHTRAAQDQRNRPAAPVQNPAAALAIAIHGDAAFPGQGIVAETLNLWNLKGYSTGGTIHIIVNNQIGFTTLPSDARSTLYAGDLAKGFEIPIVHVNADDPIACVAIARMAHAYRERFHKDFLIDLIGYRRYGHNEGDEPAFTQPQMYATIRQHPRVREIWAKQLDREGVVSAKESQAMVDEVMERLRRAREEALEQTAEPEDTPDVEVQPHRAANVTADTLIRLNEALYTFPKGFTPNDRLNRNVLQKRRSGLTAPNGIEWGHAEALAFATILADGTPIRVAGQDAQRATFGHRNAVLHDPDTGSRLVPLQALPDAKASFAIYNSPLSENAALGFEYGYSIHAPGTLVMWEAQYGDFANSAQVFIDQFLVSGAAKWRQRPALILLLPHGYEGAGPEHSSARLERYLQLAASDSVYIVNCTTAAQYFHLLRRQAANIETAPRPLIVMTPKSLLRHPRAASSLQDLVSGTFQPVLDDADARSRPERVARLILCSGKVYVDLLASAAYSTVSERVAVARVEELYPFPATELRALFQSYPNLREILWLQEEPQNMGAWQYIAPKLNDLAMLAGLGPALYAGRPDAASPAEGSTHRHKAAQARLLAAALEEIPVLESQRESVARAS